MIFRPSSRGLLEAGFGLGVGELEQSADTPGFGMDRTGYDAPWKLFLGLANQTLLTIVQ